MLESYMDKGWLLSDTDEFVGIALGYDSIGQHEVGIEPLASSLGLTEGFGLGIERHRARVCPDSLVFEELKASYRFRNKAAKAEVAILSVNGHRRGQNPAFLPPILTSAFSRSRNPPVPQDQVACAWDRGSFFVCTVGEQGAERLRLLYEAIKANDACISLSASWNPFQKSGMNLTIASKIPTDIVKLAERRDESNRRLLYAARATGIADRLKAAGRKYHALSPNWTDESETTVHFFLNPWEQHKYDFGWMTVADLDDWIRGEGKVIKPLTA